MKLFDYVYVNIYSWYYKMAASGRKVNPQSLTAIAFSIWFNGWLLLIIEVYNRYTTGKEIKVNTLIVVIAALVAGGTINAIYSQNNRYLRIYNEYITSDKIRNKKKAIFFSWVFILIPYFMFFVFLFLFLNKT